MKKNEVSLFWFRRDLRLEDNAGLFYALKGQYPIQPVFIFDTKILDKLEDKKDKRIIFIHQQLEHIQKKLLKKGATLDVRIGNPLQIYKQLLQDYNIKTLYFNHDYEPYARQRDKEVYELFQEKRIPLKHYKDQVIFEKNEVVKANGEAYTVYTPYSNKWKEQLNDFYLSSYPTTKFLKNLHQQKELKIPSLKELGFEYLKIKFPSADFDESLIKFYNKTRNIPSEEGTSKLSIHLRFGTISIRSLAHFAKKNNATFLNELIWRDFFQMILWHYPNVVTESFKKKYDNIKWRNNKKDFEAWCTGKTGYPIVDAGMRELNETGFMHNRVRMVVASFLCKHLLIDWRWGEAYFAKKLIDYDLAANNGNWQWAAGSGCDATPYFRVFNPALQTKKFDPQLKYIKQWVPEFDSDNYPKPIVEHDLTRKRALEIYGKAVKEQ